MTNSNWEYILNIKVKDVFLMKRYAELQKLKGRSFFTAADAADAFGIKPESAWVICSRYVRDGVFIRLKNNFYVLAEDWRNASREGLFRIANYLQVPSYISFMTALSYYEVTTQVQRDFIESAAVRRSVKFEAGGTEFDFYKIKRQCYFDFVKKGEIFMASKEKAFVDAAYLYSFGKYKMDTASLDMDKLDRERVKEILKEFPQKTKAAVERLCKTL